MSERSKRVLLVPEGYMLSCPYVYGLEQYGYLNISCPFPASCFVFMNFKQKICEIDVAAMLLLFSVRLGGGGGGVGGGRVVRWSWVNFQCRGVLLWMIVGEGPTALAVSAGGSCLDVLLSSIFSHLFLPLFGRQPDIDWNAVSKGR